MSVSQRVFLVETWGQSPCTLFAPSGCVEIRYSICGQSSLLKHTASLSRAIDRAVSVDGSSPLIDAEVHLLKHHLHT